MISVFFLHVHRIIRPAFKLVCYCGSVFQFDAYIFIAVRTLGQEGEQVFVAIKANAATESHAPYQNQPDARLPVVAGVGAGPRLLRWLQQTLASTESLR